MKSPTGIIKNNALGIAVVAFVTLLIASAGYAVYFALNRLPQSNKIDEVANVQTEDTVSQDAVSNNGTSNSFGFSTTPSDRSSQVLGESIDNNFLGFSNARHADPETSNIQTTKGGQTVNTGITPTAIVSKESKPDNNTDIEVTVSKYPEIERDDNDITYIYRVEFNRAAKGEADEFDYYFDGKTCENFQGESDLKSTSNIYVKIDRKYLDDYRELQKSNYEIEVGGENFDGTVYVPVCK